MSNFLDKNTQTMLLETVKNPRKYWKTCYGLNEGVLTILCFFKFRLSKRGHRFRALYHNLRKKLVGGDFYEEANNVWDCILRSACVLNISLYNRHFITNLCKQIKRDPSYIESGRITDITRIYKNVLEPFLTIKEYALTYQEETYYSDNTCDTLSKKKELYDFIKFFDIYPSAFVEYLAAHQVLGSNYKGDFKEFHKYPIMFKFIFGLASLGIGNKDIIDLFFSTINVWYSDFKCDGMYYIMFLEEDYTGKLEKYLDNHWDVLGRRLQNDLLHYCGYTGSIKVANFLIKKGAFNKGESLHIAKIMKQYPYLKHFSNIGKL